MILAQPTPRGAGVLLWGDCNDLRSLYGTVGRAVDAAPEPIGDYLVGLNYDLRHAYEGQREEKRFGVDEPDSATYRGERILWPTVLMQTALVRYYAAFFASTKEDQANIFRLEHALSEALRAYDPGVGSVCVDWMSRPRYLSNGYLMQYLDEVAHNFVISGPGGKRRFRKLPAVLASLDELSPEYRAYRQELERTAKEQGCSPHDLHAEFAEDDIDW